MRGAIAIGKTWIGLALAGLVLTACGDPDAGPATGTRGLHGGRVLHSGEFSLELLIFEGGVAPELRAWPTRGGEPVPPADVALEVALTRLGGLVDRITFEPAADFLRSGRAVEEPHSFEVSVQAVHDGETHAWRYEQLEGRTRIAAETADALGIGTSIAGPTIVEETVSLYGRIRADPERVREVRARFDGVVRSVHARAGDRVEEGDRLLTVESNESLSAYAISAPIGGIVTQRDANPGEQTGGRRLLTITDPSTVWVDLSVFPKDRPRVHVGNPVAIEPAVGGMPMTGEISTLEIVARADQSVVARVVLENADGLLLPGTFVRADVTVAEYEVPLAVRSEGLQKFRDFDVVYVQYGDEYELRRLDLGRAAGNWVEVLGGLQPGTRYVTENSHLIKADVEKSGAAHDH